ncbi:hypothetical protein F0562_025583 [Nyssa sinensis]|uniref:Uncharacterized protein n=1 Tax=Nyssa sinensis TaxID=561372 RepID=A0A5J5BCE9_9ASTE|nr:hypothetical protein F0562_025583 [Nyssa sinensis]
MKEIVAHVLDEAGSSDRADPSLNEVAANLGLEVPSEEIKVKGLVKEKEQGGGIIPSEGTLAARPSLIPPSYRGIPLPGDGQGHLVPGVINSSIPSASKVPKSPSSASLFNQVRESSTRRVEIHQEVAALSGRLAELEERLSKREQVLREADVEERRILEECRGIEA